MKPIEEYLSKKSIYPFEATPRTNAHLESEIKKAVKEWLIERRQNYFDIGFTVHTQTVNDLIAELQDKNKEVVKP